MTWPYTIVILNGDPPRGAAAQLLVRLAEKGRIIAADGGADQAAALGLCPDLVVGDGDSASRPVSDGFHYPREKDFTDGQAALTLAGEGSGPIYLFAALGGEIDHCLANLLLPLHVLARPERAHIIDDGLLAHYSVGYTQLRGQAGDRVSLVSLVPAEDLCLRGFCYPLEHYQACPGDSRTLRNELAGEMASISHKSGTLLVFHYCNRDRMGEYLPCEK